MTRTGITGALVVVAALTLTGCGTAPTLSPAGAAPTATAPAPPAIHATPTRVEIPAIAADSTLVATGLHPDGRLETPPVTHPEQASWWAGSGQPGQAGRPVVLLGHVDGNGQPGIFHRLDELRPGDEVLVAAGTARYRYVVYAVEQHPKTADQFPTTHVYGDTTTPTLRLITCGGTFDRNSGHYRDNVIVFGRQFAHS